MLFNTYWYVCSYCHFVNCFGFVFVGLFSSFPPLLSCDLMMIFNVVFGLLFLFCVYIYYWCFCLCLPWGFDIEVYMDTLLSCWSLNFKYIFKILHLYSFPLMILVLISYLCVVISYLCCMFAFTGELSCFLIFLFLVVAFSLQRSSFSICSKADAEFS